MKLFRLNEKKRKIQTVTIREQHVNCLGNNIQIKITL